MQGVHVDNGLVKIDINLVENAIRPTVIDKKNGLCFGAKEGWVENYFHIRYQREL